MRENLPETETERDTILYQALSSNPRVLVFNTGVKMLRGRADRDLEKQGGKGWQCIS